MTWQALFLNDRVIAAFVTALVGGGVVAIGWFLTHLLSRRRDKLLRNEQTRDIQRALLAEIRAHVAALEQQQSVDTAQMRQRLIADRHVPILPHDANDRIFRAVVEQVHILPQYVIDPVVRYYRLIGVRAALAQDIRSSAKDQPDRAAEMLDDYLALTVETHREGSIAMLVLSTSLTRGTAAVRKLLEALNRQEAATTKAPAMADAPESGAGDVSRTPSDPRSR